MNITRSFVFVLIIIILFLICFIFALSYQYQQSQIKYQKTCLKKCITRQNTSNVIRADAVTSTVIANANDKNINIDINAKKAEIINDSEHKSPATSEKQKVYLSILHKTRKALDRLKIPFFLSSGTCLGYFREGKFIDHDYDIDIGIFANDYVPEIVEEMRKENLILYRVMGKEDTGMELSFRLSGTPLGRHAKIDIFLHYPEKDDNGKDCYYWVSYAAPKYTKRIKYRVHKFKIKEVDFLGLKVNVPYPTIKYIEQHYGDDWMIPKKPFTEYVYSKSPKSIVKD